MPWQNNETVLAVKVSILDGKLVVDGEGYMEEFTGADEIYIVYRKRDLYYEGVKKFEENHKPVDG